MSSAQRDTGDVLITGGVGFIGSNLAVALARGGRRVAVLDNFSRAGVERNAAFLSQNLPGLRIVRGDVRDRSLVQGLVAGATEVFHFAAQVAVTTSLTDPMLDFEVNAGGTVNVLEAIRARKKPPRLLFTSTNKVYGSLPWLELDRRATRYVPSDAAIAAHGVGEDRQLDFHSPYGCSKGAADQYVIDYARSYGIPAVVFRMSCIYGRHQCGNEDQGWVAHFLLRALTHKALTIYGDGLQVRDILFADDLVRALMLASERAEELAGQAFNIGGGPTNTISLVELLEELARLTKREPQVRFEPSRAGDQRYYVSDTTRFQRATGWSPLVSVGDGIAQLHDWLKQNVLERRDSRTGNEENGKTNGARRLELP